MEFKDRLKELRTKAGLSQTELAEKIYVSRSAVAKWENGLGLPSDDSLQAIAKFFGVSKSQLIGDVETETIFVDKNKKIIRQRTISILVALVFLAVFVVYGVVIYFMALYGDRMADKLTPPPTDIKVIDDIEYRRITDDGGEYYEVSGVTKDYRSRNIYIENEIDGIPVTRIGTQAFKGLAVGKVVFNENLLCVGESAFVEAHIDSVQFNEGLEVISKAAFAETGYYDENIIFPESLRRIEDNAFYMSTYIKTVAFGSNIEYVGDRAFENCFYLHNVSFDSNVEIGEYAFLRTRISRVIFNKPDIILHERSFLDNYFFSQVAYNGTLEQWNAVAAHSDCFDKNSLYIKFIDSAEYRDTSRDYQTGMWR